MKQLVITPKKTKRETESFKLYLKDISEIKLFTPEEENICAKKASTGDANAIEELTRRNLRFVVSVAKQYVTADNLLEDLVSEGNIGLMIATEKFRPEMGFKFISYAVWWIRKIILEYLSKNGRMIRIPANKLNNLSKFDKKVKQLEQKMGRSVGLQEVINEFGGELGKESIEFLSVLSTYRTDSLDQEINHDEGDTTPLSDIMADKDTYKQADYFMIMDNMKSEVTTIIDDLKPRDKRIMIGLFGLDGKSPMSLKEVGSEVGISREMVRQVKEKVLKNLKNKLRNSDIREYE